MVFSHKLFIFGNSAFRPKVRAHSVQTLPSTLTGSRQNCFDRLSLKSYNSAAPSQSAIFCALELHKMHPFDAAEIASIEADVV
jgi:hypothetical protein